MSPLCLRFVLCLYREAWGVVTQGSEKIVLHWSKRSNLQQLSQACRTRKGFIVDYAWHLSGNWKWIRNGGWKKGDQNSQAPPFGQESSQGTYALILSWFTVLYNLMKWQLFERKVITGEKLVGEQDGRLYATFSGWGRMCCKREGCERTKPVGLISEDFTDSCLALFAKLFWIIYSIEGLIWCAEDKSCNNSGRYERVMPVRSWSLKQSSAWVGGTSQKMTHASRHYISVEKLVWEVGGRHSSFESVEEDWMGMPPSQSFQFLMTFLHM